MATPYHRHNSTATGIAADLSSSIKGKVVLTTGVSPNGLGAHFVETIAKHHPRLLILAGRSIEKVRATADKIAADPAAAGVETRILILDLASQQQIHDAAKEVLSWKDVDAIDVIVNSAGIMGGPHQTTVEGIENQFGSNHIGHFLFTNLIMSRILAAKNPRVVNISSNGNWLGPVRFSDYNFQDGKVYDMWEAYGQSKSANVLFSKGLAKRLGGKGLKSYSLHPGVTFGTSLGPGIDMDKDMAALSKSALRSTIVLMTWKVLISAISATLEDNGPSTTRQGERRI
jgi:NAD(P)-dependent dehydrogenase (short-subunit alcohol dehydrogenase family)